MQSQILPLSSTYFCGCSVFSAFNLCPHLVLQLAYHAAPFGLLSLVVMDHSSLLSDQEDHNWENVQKDLSIYLEAAFVPSKFRPMILCSLLYPIKFIYNEKFGLQYVGGR